MNNAKLWLVVKPTTGIPIFLSAVAISSFAVHVAVLTNTSWVGDFLQGKPLGSSDGTAALQDATPKATVSFPDGTTVETLEDGRQAIWVETPKGPTRAILETPVDLASLTYTN